MDKKFFLILGISLVLAVNFVSAIPLPHAFYGTVTYSNGENANGIVAAKINDINVGESTIVGGSYNLVVNSEYGGMIYFYLDNNILGNYTFSRFSVTELNFVIPKNQTNETNGGTNNTNSQEINPIQGVYFSPTQTCEPNWKCSGWSSCSGGYMARSCYDSNYCSFEYNKPAERIACETQPSQNLPPIKEESEVSSGFSTAGLTTMAVLLLLGIGTIGFFVVKKRKKI